MMDFLYRSEAPQYKGSAPAATPASGGLMSWFGRLFGGGAQPTYRRREVTVPPTEPTSESVMRRATCACVIGPADDESHDPSDDEPTAVVPATEIHIW